jgi:hypothetical protein
MYSPFGIKTAAAGRLAGVAAASFVGLAVAAGLAGPAQAAVTTPNANYQSGIYGDPAAAAPYWGLQHFSDCGEMAVADVVGQIIGNEPTERQITTVAENTPSVSHAGSVWQPSGSTRTETCQCYWRTMGSRQPKSIPLPPIWSRIWPKGAR